jgi:C-terminal processing protease CtpA/Prc
MPKLALLVEGGTFFSGKRRCTVSVDDGDELDALKAKVWAALALTAAQISSANIQVFDPDFEEHVNFEGKTQLKNKAKLRLALTQEANLEPAEGGKNCPEEQVEIESGEIESGVASLIDEDEDGNDDDNNGNGDDEEDGVGEQIEEEYAKVQARKGAGKSPTRTLDFEIHKVRDRLCLTLTGSTTNSGYNIMVTELPVLKSGKLGPAEACGIAVGDRVIAVNGMPLLPSDKVKSVLRTLALAASPIKIRIERPFQPPTAHKVGGGLSGGKNIDFRVRKAKGRLCLKLTGGLCKSTKEYLILVSGLPPLTETGDVSPAARAGIIIGDQVLAVDGQPVVGKRVRGVLMELQHADEEVELTVFRMHHSEHGDASMAAAEIDMRFLPLADQAKLLSGQAGGDLEKHQQRHKDQLRLRRTQSMPQAPAAGAQRTVELELMLAKVGGKLNLVLAGVDVESSGEYEVFVKELPLRKVSRHAGGAGGAGGAGAGAGGAAAAAAAAAGAGAAAAAGAGAAGGAGGAGAGAGGGGSGSGSSGGRSGGGGGGGDAGVTMVAGAAEMAGLQLDDHLVAIDGMAIAGMTLPEVLRLLARTTGGDGVKVVIRRSAAGGVGAGAALGSLTPRKAHALLGVYGWRGQARKPNQASPARSSISIVGTGGYAGAMLLAREQARHVDLQQETESDEEKLRALEAQLETLDARMESDGYEHLEVDEETGQTQEKMDIEGQNGLYIEEAQCTITEIKEYMREQQLARGSANATSLGFGCGDQWAGADHSLDRQSLHQALMLLRKQCEEQLKLQLQKQERQQDQPQKQKQEPQQERAGGGGGGIGGVGGAALALALAPVSLVGTGIRGIGSISSTIVGGTICAIGGTISVLTSGAIASSRLPVTSGSSTASNAAAAATAAAAARELPIAHETPLMAWHVRTLPPRSSLALSAPASEPRLLLLSSHAYYVYSFREAPTPPGAGAGAAKAEGVKKGTESKKVPKVQLRLVERVPMECVRSVCFRFVSDSTEARRRRQQRQRKEALHEKRQKRRERRERRRERQGKKKEEGRQGGEDSKEEDDGDVQQEEGPAAAYCASFYGLQQPKFPAVQIYVDRSSASSSASSSFPRPSSARPASGSGLALSTLGIGSGNTVRAETYVLRLPSRKRHRTTRQKKKKMKKKERGGELELDGGAAYTRRLIAALELENGAIKDYLQAKQSDVAEEGGGEDGDGGDGGEDKEVEDGDGAGLNVVVSSTSLQYRTTNTGSSAVNAVARKSRRLEQTEHLVHCLEMVHRRFPQAFNACYLQGGAYDDTGVNGFGTPETVPAELIHAFQQQRKEHRQEQQRQQDRQQDRQQEQGRGRGRGQDDEEERWEHQHAPVQPTWSCDYTDDQGFQIDSEDDDGDSDQLLIGGMRSTPKKRVVREAAGGAAQGAALGAPLEPGLHRRQHRHQHHQHQHHQHQHVAYNDRGIKEQANEQDNQPLRAPTATTTDSVDAAQSEGFDSFQQQLQDEALVMSTSGTSQSAAVFDTAPMMYHGGVESGDEGGVGTDSDDDPYIM